MRSSQIVFQDKQSNNFHPGGGGGFKLQGLIPQSYDYTNIRQLNGEKRIVFYIFHKLLIVIMFLN